MAIEVSTKHHGAVLPKAYERIEHVAISVNNQTVAVELARYADAASAARVGTGTKEPELARRTLVIKNVPAVTRTETDEETGETTEVEVTPARPYYDEYLGHVAKKDTDAVAASYKTLRSMAKDVDAAKPTKSREEKDLLDIKNGTDV